MKPYYQHQGVTLYHGEALAVLSQLPANSVDALICDPPYSSGGMTRGDRMAPALTKYITTEAQATAPKRGHFDFTGDNRDQRGFLYWCALWLSDCARVLRAGSPVALFTDWRQLPTTTDALQAGGFVWRGIAVWDKTRAARPTMGRFTAQAEFLAWGSHGPMPFDRGVGVLPGVFTVPVDRDDKHHATGKPSALMRAVVAVCVPHGIVLDPFAGSGTTLVAAKQTGRGAIGIELDERYCEVAAKRLEQQTLPVFEAPASAEQGGLFGGEP